jgi:hypothetical protein
MNARNQNEESEGIVSEAKLETDLIMGSLCQILESSAILSASLESTVGYLFGCEISPEGCDDKEVESGKIAAINYKIREIKRIISNAQQYANRIGGL